MLNSSEQALIGRMADPRIPERGNIPKKEGWYSQTIEEVREEDNVDDPDNMFTEYNLKLRLNNGPSKGVEWLRTSIPPPEHPDMMQKEYGDDGAELTDSDGNPVYSKDENGHPIPNGRWKRQSAQFNALMSAIYPPPIKGRNTEAKAKRQAAIMDTIQSAGSISAALSGGRFISRYYLDKGVSIDRETGEERVYSEALKKQPRLKIASIIPFTEANEKKYVLDPKNIEGTAKSGQLKDLSL